MTNRVLRKHPRVIAFASCRPVDGGTGATDVLLLKTRQQSSDRILILSSSGFAAISWWRLLKGKELARQAAAASCREHGLVLIDDTVMLESIQFRKEDPARAWGLKYRFEFARNGIPTKRRHRTDLTRPPPPSSSKPTTAN